MYFKWLVYNALYECVCVFGSHVQYDEGSHFTEEVCISECLYVGYIKSPIYLLLLI